MPAWSGWQKHIGKAEHRDSQGERREEKPSVEEDNKTKHS